MMDFLIRRGAISPDHPEYLAVATGLRQSLFGENLGMGELSSFCIG